MKQLYFTAGLSEIIKKHASNILQYDCLTISCKKDILLGLSYNQYHFQDTIRAINFAREVIYDREDMPPSKIFQANTPSLSPLVVCIYKTLQGLELDF